MTVEYEIDSKTGERRVKFAAVAEKPTNALTASELAALEDMSKEELIALVRRIAGSCDMIPLALLSPDEIKASTRLRLADIALRNKDDKTALVAIQQLLDRLEGKPLGASPSIMIGSGGGSMKVEVVLISADQHRASKIIDN